MGRRQSRKLSIADQLRVWKAALALSDCRRAQPQALSQAVHIIEEQQAELDRLTDENRRLARNQWNGKT